MAERIFCVERLPDLAMPKYRPLWPTCAAHGTGRRFQGSSICCLMNLEAGWGFGFSSIPSGLSRTVVCGFFSRYAAKR